MKYSTVIWEDFFVVLGKEPLFTLIHSIEKATVDVAICRFVACLRRALHILADNILRLEHAKFLTGVWTILNESSAVLWREPRSQLVSTVQIANVRNEKDHSFGFNLISLSRS